MTTKEVSSITYHIKARVLGPIFIDSGETVGTLDYVYDKKNHRIHFIDQEKLAATLVEKNLVNDFVNNVTRLTSNFQIASWLNNHRLDFHDYIKNSVYAQNLSKSKQISLFMRNANGDVYVPGSSIKGALKGALLWNEIQAQNLKFENLNITKEKLKNLINEVDSKYQISVSDSLPISSEQLRVDALTTINAMNQENEQKSNEGQNRLVEYIRPTREGTLIEFDLEIKNYATNNIKDSKYFTISKLLNNLTSIQKRYHERFLMPFERQNLISEKAMNTYPSKFGFFLGQNTGFGSKTLISALTQHEVENLEVVRNILFKKFRNHKHENDSLETGSPHVLHVHNDCFIGSCQIQNAKEIHSMNILTSQKD